MMKSFALTIIIILSFILSACGGDKHSELRKYVKKVQARPATSVPPLPKLQNLNKYAYASSNKRSPFDQPKRAKPTTRVMPDLNRPKQELEAFALDSLKMVGTMGRGQRLWALVSAPNGNVYRVSMGSYVGKNFGRVTKITRKEILLVETIPNGQGGWVHRKTQLDLHAQ